MRLNASRQVLGAQAGGKRQVLPAKPTVGEVTAEQLHHGGLATIDDVYGVVVPTAADLT